MDPVHLGHIETTKLIHSKEVALGSKVGKLGELMVVPRVEPQSQIAGQDTLDHRVQYKHSSSGGLRIQRSTAHTVLCNLRIILQHRMCRGLEAI